MNSNNLLKTTKEKLTMKRQSMQQFIENNFTGKSKDKLLKYYKQACHLDYMENQDYHKEYRKKYYQEHKEELKEYHKKYYQEHKDNYKEYSKRYREKHKEEVNKCRKAEKNK
jgi:hypothetical protein